MQKANRFRDLNREPDTCGPTGRPNRFGGVEEVVERTVGHVLHNNEFVIVAVSSVVAEAN